MNIIHVLNILTLFAWMGLLSSRGSTAAALTLNRTPMRAANTTRSCMLWQECSTSATGAGDQSVWQCVCVCVSEIVWATQTDWRSRWRAVVVKIECCSWWQLLIRSWKTQMFLLLYLQSPPLFYTSPPLQPSSATDVEAGGCVTDGVSVCVRVLLGVSVREHEKEKGRWRGQDTTNGNVWTFILWQTVAVMWTSAERKQLH